MNWKSISAKAFTFALLLILTACSLPMSPTPGIPAPVTPNPAEITVIPTQADNPVLEPTFPPTATPESSPTTAATSIPPTATTPAIIVSTSLPTSAPASGSSGAVILIAKGSTLDVHILAAASSPSIAELAPDARGFILTGKEINNDNTRWVEVALPEGKTGWVDGFYITADVPAVQFAADPQVMALINAFKKALIDKNGEMLASLVSPSHGLRLRFVRNGTLADYDTAKANWVLQSTYVMDWGLAPGSGLPVKGTFSAQVLPSLMDVLNSAETQVKFGELAAGGASYDITWPVEYSGVNFLSLYRPGSASQELDWSTWLVGVEYVGGKPYLFSLDHLAWEP